MAKFIPVCTEFRALWGFSYIGSQFKVHKNEEELLECTHKASIYHLLISVFFSRSLLHATLLKNTTRGMLQHAAHFCTSGNIGSSAAAKQLRMSTNLSSICSVVASREVARNYIFGGKFGKIYLTRELPGVALVNCAI